MAAKFQVNMHAWLSVSVNVEFTDDELAEIAKKNEMTVEELLAEGNEDIINEYASNKGFTESEFYLCAQCSGWDRKFSADVGEFEPDDEDEVIRIK